MVIRIFLGYHPFGQWSVICTIFMESTVNDLVSHLTKQSPVLMFSWQFVGLRASFILAKNLFFCFGETVLPSGSVLGFGMFLFDDICTAFTTGPAYKREPWNPNILSSEFHIKERSDLKTTDICQRQRYFYLFEGMSFGTTAKPNPVHRGV